MQAQQTPAESTPVADQSESIVNTMYNSVLFIRKIQQVKSIGQKSTQEDHNQSIYDLDQFNQLNQAQYQKTNIKIIQLIGNKFRIQLNYTGMKDEKTKRGLKGHNCIFVQNYLQADGSRSVKQCNQHINGFDRGTAFQFIHVKDDIYQIRHAQTNYYLCVIQTKQQGVYAIRAYKFQSLKQNPIIKQGSYFDVKSTQLKTRKAGQNVDSYEYRKSIPGQIISKLSIFKQKYPKTIRLLKDFFYNAEVFLNVNSSEDQNKDYIREALSCDASFLGKQKKITSRDVQIQPIQQESNGKSYVRVKIKNHKNQYEYLMVKGVEHKDGDRRVASCKQEKNDFDDRTRFQIKFIDLKQKKWPQQQKLSLNNQKTEYPQEQKNQQSGIYFQLMDCRYECYLYIDPNLSSQGYRPLFASSRLEFSNRSWFYLCDMKQEEKQKIPQNQGEKAEDNDSDSLNNSSFELQESENKQRQSSSQQSDQIGKKAGQQTD